MNTDKAIYEKFEILEKCKIQLKKEFIGIDLIIDEVTESLSSWYLFPELQERPVIINLWGLTGVGKTDLVNRISELIDFSKKYYHIDMGEKPNYRDSIKNKIETIYEYDNGYPVMIGLDEFQYARTINEDFEEIENDYSRIIWSLLDSGKFPTSRSYSYTEELYELISRLKYLLTKGIKIQNGEVTNLHDLFNRIMNTNLGEAFTIDQKMMERLLGSRKNNEESETVNTDKEGKKLLFISQQYRDLIYEAMREFYDNYEEFEFNLNKLKGYENIQYIYNVITHANSEKIVDCSKAIIFIMGNLDEAYTMNKNFSSDMSADEFHEESLKITLPMIKNALKSRFRSEQIARLGNTHIIYPAFSKNSFEKIIKMELNKICKKYSKLLNATIEFDITLEKMIYEEAVFPTQGIRPIFTSIHQMLTSRFGEIMMSIHKDNIDCDRIKFSFEGSTLFIKYYLGKSLVYTKKNNPQLRLKSLRKNTKDDLQAIVAVHEAGHAVISSMLLETVPETIHSVIADSESNGFVFTKLNDDYIRRDELKNRIALYLGGYVAEKIIFGKEYITDGSESDIKRATKLVNHLIKKAGFGNIPASYNVKSSETWDSIHDIDNEKNQLAEMMIKDGMELAEKGLIRDKTLLINIANFLSDNQSMEKQQIKLYIEKYAVGKSIEDVFSEKNYYRKCLKEQFNGLNQNVDSDNNSINKTPLMLNKGGIYE